MRANARHIHEGGMFALSTSRVNRVLRRRLTEKSDFPRLIPQKSSSPAEDIKLLNIALCAAYWPRLLATKGAGSLWPRRKAAEAKGGHRKTKTVYAEQCVAGESFSYVRKYSHAGPKVVWNAANLGNSMSGKSKRCHGKTLETE